MTENTDLRVACIAYGDDPLAHTAERILTRFESVLPRLTEAVVLLPEGQAIPRLRRLLAEAARRRGHQALLGPRIDTLRRWAESLYIPGLPRLAAGRELILAEALNEHRALFGEIDPWRLADSLMDVFDELTLHRCELPDELAPFLELLRRGYGIDDDGPALLGREATLVHTLWRAWHAQLHAEGRLDPHAAYLLRLRQSLAQLAPEPYFYLVGFDTFAPPERQWAKTLIQRGQGELILHGATTRAEGHPDAPLGRLAHELGPVPPAGPEAGLAGLLDSTFARDGAPLRARARAFAGANPLSPAQGRLAIFSADDAEHEAHGVDLQVRRWLLAGRHRIAIVTEDRRLARRVRALLERAGVTLQDSGGWTLSTTSAAAVLERWLEALEEDFAHGPLMDLLKSPFLVPDADAEAYRQGVFRLEQDIILHENVARGLERYRRQLRLRRERLGWPGQTTAQVECLLDRLQRAATPLLALRDGAHHPPGRFLDALRGGLEALGAWHRLAADPAGYRLVQRIEGMYAACCGRTLTLDWSGFRSWLARTLERTHFRPATAGSAVQLLNLSQSRLGHFDALILAGAQREHLPGSGQGSPYFNDGVRAELGLPGWDQTVELRLHHFRRLLEAAPEVLITRRREHNGEPAAPCPWLQALRTFHELAYGTDLEEERLAHLARDRRTQVLVAAQAAPPTARPQPKLPSRLLPRSLSAGAHQRLIDCPYLFFAADGLGLQPRDEVRETLEKSDYGQRVHRCLEAFHGEVPNLPGPFGEALIPESRRRAIELLREIAAAQFARDLEDNFMHRGWLKRWLALIPAYVDWQIERQAQWAVRDVELKTEAALGHGWRLRGRLDRVDLGAEGAGIIDYKTGMLPRGEAVAAGEAVQLPSYALLLEHVQRVEYLQLDNGEVKTRAALEGEDLAALRAEVGQRLVDLLDRVEAGSPLPAGSDEQACRRCALGGVCRRQAWASEPQSTPVDRRRGR